MSLNKEFTINMMKVFHTINQFPSFLRCIDSRFANMSNDIKRAIRLDPLIKEWLEQEAKHGKDWPNKPSVDALSVGNFTLYIY
ncbi:hypothetical protein F5887DRAFT_1072549 [Amanita rubescens]|nr:hypothetical protein F5887DRAFT_1072549 [Amanita rubescens]